MYCHYSLFSEFLELQYSLMLHGHCNLFYMIITIICLCMLDRWNIIINNVPENLACVNIMQWVVQLRYSFFIVHYVVVVLGRGHWLRPPDLQHPSMCPNLCFIIGEGGHLPFMSPVLCHEHSCDFPLIQNCVQKCVFSYPHRLIKFYKTISVRKCN